MARETRFLGARGEAAGQVCDVQCPSVGLCWALLVDYSRVDLNPGVVHHPQKGNPWVEVHLGSQKVEPWVCVGVNYECREVHANASMLQLCLVSG